MLRTFYTSYVYAHLTNRYEPNSVPTTFKDVWSKNLQNTQIFFDVIIAIQGLTYIQIMYPGSETFENSFFRNAADSLPTKFLTAHL